MSPPEKRELWQERWWLAEDYTRVYEDRISPEKVDQAIGQVAKVFDSAWAEATPRHPAYFSLLSQGLMPLQFLYGLGSDLIEVDGCLRLPSVIRDLKDPNDYESALFELEIAAHLKRSGHAIEFRPTLPNGKCSDILAALEGQRVYIEIKRLRESVLQAALHALTQRIAFAMSDLTAETGMPTLRGKGFLIELDGSVPGLFGNGIEVDQDIMESIKGQIVAEIRNRAESGDSLDFVLPSVARVHIGGAPAGSSVNCPMAPPVGELRRVVNGRIQEAIQQLHPDHPGIAIFKTPGGLELEMTQVILRGLLQQLGPKAKHLTAVIFFPEYFGLTVAWARFRPFVVSNPNAAVTLEGLKAYEHITQLLAVDVKTPYG